MFNSPEYIVSTVGYTQEQLDAAVEAVIEATKEKAAKKVEWYIGMNQEWFELTPQELAAAIRSMK